MFIGTPLIQIRLKCILLAYLLVTGEFINVCLKYTIYSCNLSFFSLVISAVVNNGHLTCSKLGLRLNIWFSTYNFKPAVGP